MVTVPQFRVRWVYLSMATMILASLHVPATWLVPFLDRPVWSHWQVLEPFGRLAVGYPTSKVSLDKMRTVVSPP